MTDGPDFICVGMQKAGTGWLYDQLQHHPDFWMPPIKEIHYLDRDEPTLNTAKRMADRLEKKERRSSKAIARRRSMDERDTQFLNEVSSLSGKPRDIEKYAAMFRFKEGKITGDVTPGYSGMTEDAIRDVARRLPEVRIVQLVRDPVSRIWSQLSMAARRERFNLNVLKEPERLRSFLERMSNPEDGAKAKVDIQKVSFPARVAKGWEKNAPNLRFQHFFFDDIVTRPDALRREIILYLGADPASDIGGPPAEHNRKSQHEKLPITDGIKAVLVEFLGDELRACVRRYGGHAVEWAKTYGV